MKKDAMDLLAVLAKYEHQLGVLMNLLQKVIKSTEKHNGSAQCLANLMQNLQREDVQEVVDQIGKLVSEWNKQQDKQEGPLTITRDLVLPIGHKIEVEHIMRQFERMNNVAMFDVAELDLGLFRLSRTGLYEAEYFLVFLNQPLYYTEITDLLIEAGYEMVEPYEILMYRVTHTNWNRCRNVIGFHEIVQDKDKDECLIMLTSADEAQITEYPVQTACYCASECFFPSNHVFLAVKRNEIK